MSIDPHDRAVAWYPLPPNVRAGRVGESRGALEKGRATYYYPRDFSERPAAERSPCNHFFLARRW
ncbi:MAG: hypothetical protein ABI876_17425, partial [Bacteroidota bacterium]